MIIMLFLYQNTVITQPEKHTLVKRDLKYRTDFEAIFR